MSQNKNYEKQRSNLVSISERLTSIFKLEKLQPSQKIDHLINDLEYNKNEFETMNKNSNEFEEVIIKALQEIEEVLKTDNLNKEQDLKSNKFFEEIWIVGKLLERAYINSTDIEYSQFYNKEFTLLIDNLINEEKIENNIKYDEIDLEKKVNSIFSKIEKKKEDYFM